jgi:hypothetical protein
MSAPLPHDFSAAVPPVPVFNCVLHVAEADAAGIITARAANLIGIVGEGRTKRQAIASAVAAFKAAAAAHHARGEAIPFLASPASPGPGETELLIAVHL